MVGNDIIVLPSIGPAPDSNYQRYQTLCPFLFFRQIRGQYISAANIKLSATLYSMLDYNYNNVIFLWVKIESSALCVGLKPILISYSKM